MNYKEALQPEVFKYITKATEILQLESYVIGGFVRDHILQRGLAKDIDVVTVGSGIELAKKVAELLPTKPKVQVFKTYGTAMLRYKEIEVEFVGARCESYSEDSRNPQVEEGTLQDDQNRRDFTINALALSLNKKTFGDLLDPFGGVEDLQRKIIRTPLDPDITYSDDPLRMMRAIRFATQLGFEIEENSLNAITKNAKRIDIITRERIVVELNKILASPLKRLIPELTALKGVEEVEGQKHKDNFYHTLEVVDNISEHTDNVWLRWSALLHDIGKAPTKKFDKKIGWTFHSHEFVKMVMLSSRPIVLATEVTDSAVRRLVFDTGNDIDSLMTLCEADITTKNPKKFKRYHNNFKIVRAKIKEVEERDRVRNFQPPISGEEIMKTFNLQPCREIGQIKEAIKNAILDGIIPNEYDECYQFMIEKGDKLGLKKI